MVAAVGFAVAFLSFVLLQDPGKGYAGGVGETGAVSRSLDSNTKNVKPSLVAEESAAAVNAMVEEMTAGAQEEVAAGPERPLLDRRQEGDAVDKAVALVGGAGEERESFQEALGIVFESNTVKLVGDVTCGVDVVDEVNRVIDRLMRRWIDELAARFE